MPNIYYRQITYSDGGSYVGYGYDRNGLFVRHGKGTCYWPNGDQYEGDWVDDNRTGKGKVCWGNSTQWAGECYEGDFLNNNIVGRGTYYWSNGDRYGRVPKRG